MEYIDRGIQAKLMGLAMEAAIVFFFGNFVYTFAGKKYLQRGGGPIGARLTMAVARIVKEQWKNDFDDNLMCGLYVDDGRSFMRLLELGNQLYKSLNKIVLSENALVEDTTRGISKIDLTKEQILLAMNSVNDDLEFTMETHMDFADGRLPTLSFSLWPGQRKIHYSYFEKEMRNQVLVMERTAMSRQSIMSIMSNELMRRLQVVDESLEIEESINIVEKYVQQLVNSGYGWRQIRDICVSALTGFKRQEINRKLLKRPKFRSSQESLNSRWNKKLNEKFNWFKRRKTEKKDVEKKI